jgi:hypothetical protein
MDALTSELISLFEGIVFGGFLGSLVVAPIYNACVVDARKKMMFAAAGAYRPVTEAEQLKAEQAILSYAIRADSATTFDPEEQFDRDIDERMKGMSKEEAVAKVICELDGEPPDCAKYYIGIARAAIAAADKWDAENSADGSIRQKTINECSDALGYRRRYFSELLKQSSISPRPRLRNTGRARQPAGFDHEGGLRMITYGQVIRWTRSDGAVLSVIVRDCGSHEEALRMAIDDAKSMGWTPPKWWQWWRWDETVRRDIMEEGK